MRLYFPPFSISSSSSHASPSKSRPRPFPTRLTVVEVTSKTQANQPHKSPCRTINRALPVDTLSTAFLTHIPEDHGQLGADPPAPPKVTPSPRSKADCNSRKPSVRFPIPDAPSGPSPRNRAIRLRKYKSLGGLQGARRRAAMMREAEERPRLEAMARRAIPEAELEKLRCLFYDMDYDGNGSVDSSELGDFLHKMLNVRLTEREVKTLLNKVDTNKSGRLEFRELIECYQHSKVYGKKSADPNTEDADALLARIASKDKDGRKKQGETVENQHMQALEQLLLQEYDLDLDLEELFLDGMDPSKLKHFLVDPT